MNTSTTVQLGSVALTSPVSEQLPLSPEMVLTAAREVMAHMHSLNKPYSAGVVADCILTIENLLSRGHAQKAKVSREDVEAFVNSLNPVQQVYLVDGRVQASWHVRGLEFFTLDFSEGFHSLGYAPTDSSTSGNSK